MTAKTSDRVSKAPGTALSADDLIDKYEVAALLGVSPVAVKSAKRNASLPNPAGVGLRRGHRVLVWRRSDVTEFANKRRLGELDTRTFHGLSDHPLYGVWHAMHARVDPNNKNTATKSYKDLSVGVCSEWHDVSVFIAWGKANGYRKGFDIDRENNSKGYTPDNCRFIDRSANLSNTRVSRLWFVLGDVYASRADAGALLAVSATCIRTNCNGAVTRGRRYPPKPGYFSVPTYQGTRKATREDILADPEFYYILYAPADAPPLPDEFKT